MSKEPARKVINDVVCPLFPDFDPPLYASQVGLIKIKREGRSGEKIELSHEDFFIDGSEEEIFKIVPDRTDEQDLEGQFGGGIYWLYAYEPENNKKIERATRRIIIDGPKRRRGELVDDEEADDEDEEREKEAEKTQDRLYKMMQEQTRSNERSFERQLRMSERSAQERLRLVEKQNAKEAEMQTSFSVAMMELMNRDRNSSSHEETIRMLREENSSLRMRVERELDDMRRAHREEISRRDRDLDEARREEKRRAERDADELRSRYQKERETLEARVQELTKQNIDLEKDLNEAEVELKAAQDANAGSPSAMDRIMGILQAVMSNPAAQQAGMQAIQAIAATAAASKVAPMPMPAPGPPIPPPPPAAAAHVPIPAPSTPQVEPWDPNYLQSVRQSAPRMPMTVQQETNTQMPPEVISALRTNGPIDPSSESSKAMNGVSHDPSKPEVNIDTQARS